MPPAGGAEDLVAQLALADVAGAGVDRHDQVGRRIRQALERIDGVVLAVVVPAVLADHEADLRAADAQHAGDVRPGLEVPALVEDVVGGQQLLVIVQQQLAVADHQQRIAEGLAGARVAGRRADDPVQRAHLARGRQQRRHRAVEALAEVFVVEQVGRVVAGQRQLREDDQVRAVVPGAPRRVQVQRQVAFEVADGGIDLRDGDLEHDFAPQLAVTRKTCRR